MPELRLPLILRVIRLTARMVVPSVGCPMRMRAFLLRVLGAKVSGSARLLPGLRFVWGHIEVGEDVLVGHDCYFEDDDWVTVGARTWIAAQSRFLTVTHQIGSGEQRAVDPPRVARISIGRGCWIGAGVTVLPGVTIGDGCVVGAAAVVTEDCEPNGLYVGMPARRIRDLP